MIGSGLAKAKEYGRLLAYNSLKYPELKNQFRLTLCKEKFDIYFKNKGTYMIFIKLMKLNSNTFLLKIIYLYLLIS